MAHLCLILPRPPSINSLFRDRRGAPGRALSKRYREWIAEADLAMMQQPRKSFKGDVTLEFAVGPRNNRADVMNFVKAPEDLLVKWKIIEDDRFVTKATVEWDDEVVGCRILIEGKERSNVQD